MFNRKRICHRLIAAFLPVVAVAYCTAASAYQAETVTSPGTIVGIVRFDGTPPQPEKIAVTKDVEVCGKQAQYDRSLVVGKDHAIANAVVALPDIDQGKQFPPAQDYKFDQAGCEYTPRVLAFPAGAPLDIINSDGILHNVHDFPTNNPQINMAQPGFKKVIRIHIANPDIIRVECDAHNWMRGWWYVAANPYYAVTGADGQFTLTDVPPGTYTIRVWQEKLGTQERKVTVAPGAEVTVDFTLSAKPN
jgi:Carboxypeptidase regulatory-like domain